MLNIMFECDPCLSLLWKMAQITIAKLVQANETNPDHLLPKASMPHMAMRSAGSSRAAEMHIVA